MSQTLLPKQLRTNLKEQFRDLPKLKPGDKVAILSPSFAAPAKWPHVYELGLKRLREIFELEPVEFPTTKKIGATGEERARDIIAAFANPDIKAVIASLGGDDQITYIRKYLTVNRDIIKDNPKPFFGYSDNTHLVDFLWSSRIPSFYGGHIFTEFAMQGGMDDFTVQYLKHALFKKGMVELTASKEFNDIGLDWGDKSLLMQRRRYQANEGWIWDGKIDTEGITWGGCVESIDELLRHGVQFPTLEEFKGIVLFVETSEEMPPHDYVRRIFRALGERGILANIRALIVGRPKAWEFDKQYTDDEKSAYKLGQRKMVLEIVRAYNPSVPIVQNLDIGHTSPQICLPVGKLMQIYSVNQKISVEF